MKQFKLNFKSIVQTEARWLLTLFAILTLGVGQMWGNKGFFDDGQWNVQYYYTGNSNTWMAGNYKNGSTQNLGIMTTFYLKGCWVKTWGDENVYNVKFMYGYTDHSESGNYTKYYNDGDHSQGYKGDYTWTFDNLINFNVIANAPNSVGANTLWVRWSLDGDAVTSGTSYINFTIPGFTTTSTTATIVSALSSNNSATISFGQHHGTALTTSNCSITGTDRAQFSVTSISETGVTVRFTPSSAGVKTATLTITDAHSKTCTISLTGKSKVLVTYSKGSASGASGSNVTDDKVYGVNLTLKDKGSFSRTGYTQTAWNTNTAGTGGTSYALKGNYTSNSAITLYPTWTANKYDVTLKANTGTGDDQLVQATYDATMPTTLKAGGAITVHTKTGYTLLGYWDNASIGTQYYSYNAGTSTLSSSRTWNKTSATNNLFAHWSANTYRVTLDVDEEHKGNIASATTYQDVTYDGATTTVPNRPTAEDGYALDGYYTGHNGAGIKVINANGTWIASVTGYTDGSKRWIHDGNVTLYAYYKKAEITALTLDAFGVNPGEGVGVTPTISPIPTGTYTVCWYVLHSNGNPLDNPPTVTWNGTKATFTAPLTSGTYKIACALRTGSGSAPYYGGTLLDSATVNFQVAGEHTVTIQYKCGDDVIKASTTITGRPLDWSSTITAPAVTGYTFHHWVLGDGISINTGAGQTTGDSETQGSTNITIKATYDGTLTAVYRQKGMIYFKNTLNWSSVRVNFLDGGYWTTDKGTGNKSKSNCNLLMTQIAGTDIWYYDYEAASITPTKYVSFTQESMNNYENFYQTSGVAHVVYPTMSSDALGTEKADGLGFYAKTPMFVPLAIAESDGKLQNNNKARYYNDGYWTKYSAGTGYKLTIYQSDGTTVVKELAFTSDNELMPMKVVTDLEANRTYKFKLTREGDVDYGNASTVQYNTFTGGATPWKYTQGIGMTSLKTNAAGDYTFNLSYSANASSQYRLRISVDFPAGMGDFRLTYTDNDTWSRGVAHSLGTWIMPSRIITHRANGVDTISFFISKGHTPKIRWQKATSTGVSSITWGTTEGTNCSTWLTTGVTDVSESGVYNFKVTQNAAGTSISSIERIGKYTGNYYIRTDCANSKWDNYSSDPDHMMTYSEYSIDHGGYSHYYCHWVKSSETGRKNVKFVIANDYSMSISDTLTREVASSPWTNIATYIDASGNILRDANVRFMWNQSTNKISRAYVDGAQEKGSYFLEILSADHKIHDPADDTELTRISFDDKENWVYEQNIKAQPGALIKLRSTWGTGGTAILQYFKGSSSTTEALIGGTSSDWYDIRVIYDFKTNRLIASWVPADQTLSADNPINADIMFIREHQGDIAQLTFTGDGKISKIETAYGVLRLSKWTLNNKSKTLPHSPLGSPASVFERSLFWISFPFRVKLSEVFGFGTYGEHWAIQRYDGADRAARGHFAENGSFWKWMNRSSEYLEPNQGYLLAVDLDLLRESSDVWGPDSRSDRIELYFPSSGDMPDITKAVVNCTIPEHTCTIDRATTEGLPRTNDPRTSYDRTIFDSHWNVISVPTYLNTNDVTFANTTWITAGDGHVGPKFLYTWNQDDNTITATSGSTYTYHAMHAYMTQYSGVITWDANHVASIVARKTYAARPREVEFRLELQQNEQMIDRTYVALSDDEETSAGFRFGEDLTKEFNANKANIYTFIADEATAAGNTLPMSDQTTIVPVGVDIKTNGDYTFAIPDGTSGVGVTLIDTEANTRTSLSALSYTVNLTAGTHDGRFLLEIAPIQQTPTDIDLINGENGENGVRKMLINQQMYIIRDGKIYDARGARVQ